MNVTRDSLNWAKEHVFKEGDTDLFPLPFEFEILKDINRWNDVAQSLAQISIESHVWSNFRSLLIPKDELSFRRAIQLDPADTLLLLAIIRTVGKTIEVKRVPIRHNVVYSYRFSAQPGGQLYRNIDGWRSFWRKGMENANIYSFVLITDLTDFYNQIYHHNLENMFNYCGVPVEAKDAIMNLCKATSLGVSRGIPIGPHASHLLAEMSMIPVDEFLHESGYIYTRYVDDIHIFCNSYEDAQIALYDLARSLDNHQKILPSRHKTRIISSDEYIEEAGSKTKDIPINDLEQEMLNVMGEVTKNPYERRAYDDIPINKKNVFSVEKIASVLDEYLDKSNVDFVRLRWFIRRLGQFGIPEGVEPVVERIHRLNAALGDAGSYLRSAQPAYKGDWSSIGEKLLAALGHPVVQKSEYLKIILLGLFHRVGELNHVPVITKQFDTSTPYLKREILLVADSARHAAWMRSVRDTYNQLDVWSKRAMIYASRQIPEDERRFWLGRINVANVYDKAIADYVR